MGLNPWKSPLDVWLEKTGRQEPPDLSDKQAVEWGTRLEEVVARKFAEMHPEYKVLRKNCTMVSKDRPWAFANIDRELRGDGKRGILECKTAGLRSEKDWVFGPPDHYICQVQHYLSITGWDFIYVAVLIGGQDYREFEIPRDDEDIAAIDKAVDTFWGFVTVDEIPELTGQKAEGQALASLHPEPSSEYIRALDIDLPELDERARLKERIDALEERRRLLDSQLKERIGDARGIQTESVKCTWVRSKSKVFDAKAFDRDHPGMRDAYITVKAKDGGLRLSYAE
jgi:putative phage-type endonuclease